ncbi:MAG: hypothetical protein NDI70_03565 [Pseudomonas sagittaria]|nr:hypothetical protein [Pseudomonas sagittaria]
MAVVGGEHAHRQRRRTVVGERLDALDPPAGAELQRLQLAAGGRQVGDVAVPGQLGDAGEQLHGLEAAHGG